MREYVVCRKIMNGQMLRTERIATKKSMDDAIDIMEGYKGFDRGMIKAEYFIQIVDKKEV